MKDLLIKTLEPLNYPIFLQGSMSQDTNYPESFFTFWNNTADGASFYDNNEHVIIWNFDLNFYSDNPELVNTELLKAKKLLKQEGFIITGAGHDVLSDEITHTGRGITVYKIENLGENEI